MPSVQYSFDFNPTSVTVSRTTGLSFNSGDGSTNNLYEFTTSSTQYAHLREYRFFSTTGAFNLVLEDLWLPPSSTIRIQTQAANIRLQINGVTWLAVTSVSFSDGEQKHLAEIYSA